MNFEIIEINSDKTEILAQIYYHFKWKVFGTQVKPSCKILKNYKIPVDKWDMKSYNSFEIDIRYQYDCSHKWFGER